jgi:SAM-dependent methyltransferase
MGQLNERTARMPEAGMSRDLLAHLTQTAPDYIERNKSAWNQWAPGLISAGRRAWQADELRWGLWGKEEAELRLLDGFGAREDVIELGCGTAAICAWLARRDLRPVAVDFSPAQLRTLETFQDEFGVSFPIVRGNAEEVPFDYESFDLALSEYGASIWSDPRRWLPEAHRLLRPEGRLIFFTNSAMLISCTPYDGGPAEERLIRDYFSRYRVEFESNGPVEFHLTHGDWIRLLHDTGFTIENLIEVRPDSADQPRFDLVSTEWARCWPSEEIWIASKRS